MSQTHLSSRLLIGNSLVLAVIAIIYLSSYPFFHSIFAFLAAGVIGASLWEFYQMCNAKGYRPYDLTGIVGSIAFTFALFLSTQAPIFSALPLMVLILLLFSVFLAAFRKWGSPLLEISTTLFGVVYLTIPLSTSILINYYFPAESPQDGRWWLFFLLLVTKMADTGAFISGKQWGRHRLAPYISPNKTWEGLIGGITVALITTLIFWAILQEFMMHSPISLSLTEALFLALGLSAVGQFGDLAESLLKRDADVKDSNQLPGLGGVLDIIDSLVFTSPILYTYLYCFY